MYLSEMYVPNEQCGEGGNSKYSDTHWNLWHYPTNLKLVFTAMPFLQIAQMLIVCALHCYDCNVCFCLVQLFTRISGSVSIKGPKKWVLQLLSDRFIWKSLYLNRMSHWKGCVCVCFVQNNGYSTLGEALNHLDFTSAIQDLPRFNYIAKVSTSQGCCMIFFTSNLFSNYLFLSATCSFSS